MTNTLEQLQALQAEQTRWMRRLYAWGYKSKDDIKLIRARLSEIENEIAQLERKDEGE